jgi:hypothetical protein
MDSPELPVHAGVSPTASRPSGTAEVPKDADRPPTAPRRTPIWLLALGVGILAGGLAGLGGEVTNRAFPVWVVHPKGNVVARSTEETGVLSFPVQADLPPEFDSLDGYVRTGARSVILKRGLRVAEGYKAAAAFGLVAALLGIGLGLTGGLARGTVRSGLFGALLGGLGGLATAVALALLLVPLFFRLQDSAESAQFQNPDAPSSLFLLLVSTHAGISAGIGAVVGLGLGLGLGERRRIAGAVLGGLAGGCVGAFASDAINSLAYPLMRTYVPVAEEPIPRVLALFCVAVATALFAGWAAGDPRRR